MAEPNILAEYRRMVEERLQQQIARHLMVERSTDRRRIVDIQIQQEKEGLEKLIEKEEDPVLIGGFRALINWLPELAQKLKARH